MGFKSKIGIQWTDLELEGLLEDEDSCVYLERIKKHLGLHPFHLTNLNAALREILNANLNSHDPELDGLVLAYKNPKLLSPLGDILYDTCYVHIDIEADFYIFRPKIGQSLKGFVNKKGRNHIGILLHKTFNVSIPKPDDDNETENDEEWPGHIVNVGQEIRFTPDEIDYKTRLPYIRGSLHAEEYLNGCKLFDKQVAATFEYEFQDLQNCNTKPSNIKKKITLKTENKRTVFNSDSEVEVDSESNLANQSKINDSAINSENEKREKFSFSTLLHSQNSSSDQESEVSHKKIKKHKKKLSKHKIKNDTEDEKNDKLSLIGAKDHSSLDDLTDNERNEKLLKKLKKRKRKSTFCDDTEDEKKYKSSIDKSVYQNVNSTNGAEMETELQGTLEKQNKIYDSDNNEDEKKTKTKIKKHLFQNLLEADTNNDLELSQTPSKKRRKKYSDCDDTEDEKKYKSTIKKNLSQNLLGTEITDNNAELSQTPVKKQKKKFNDCSDTEDEKKYKSTIKKNFSTKLIDYSIEQEETVSGTSNTVLKKQKKKLYDGDDTEDEKKCKSTIKNSTSNLMQSSTDKLNSQSELTEVLSKNKEKIFDCDDTEDEKKYKSQLKKNLAQNLNNVKEIEVEQESSKKSMKRKRSLVENDECNDTEDEKRIKKSLKVLVQNMAVNDSDITFKEPLSPPKKKKKKHSEINVNNIANGSGCRSQTIVSDDSGNNSVLVKAWSKNDKYSAPEDDLLMDTEDEKNYKSSLKTLIQNIESENQVNNSELKEYKKKHKKKRKKSNSEVEFETDPILVKVKVEPESEAEEKGSKKKKDKKAESKKSSSDNENIQMFQNTTKNVLKDEHNEKSEIDDKHFVNNDLLDSIVKTEEEEETRKRLKKEKRNKENCK